MSALSVFTDYLNRNKDDGANWYDLNPRQESPLISEDAATMLSQVGLVGSRSFLGKTEFMSFVGGEILLNRRLREKTFQSRGYLKAQGFIKRDEPLIKGGIVQTRKAEPIVNGEPRLRMGSPRKDVGGNQEFTNGQAADSAFPIKIV